MKSKLCLLFLLFCLMINQAAHTEGLPLSTTTTLPAPESFDLADHGIITSILRLPVFKDSEDENQYYYVPPFRLYEYDQGSASLLINIPKSDNVYRAQTNLDVFQLQPFPQEVFERDALVVEFSKRLARKTDQIEKLNEDLEELKERILELEERRMEAIEKGNQQLIKAIEEMIAKRYQLIEDNLADPRRASLAGEYQAIEKQIDERFIVLKRVHILNQLSSILTPIAAAGIALDTARFANPEDIPAAAKDAVSRLKRSQGGLLTVNLYTGFTQKELQDIAYYKRKYMPQLKITLLDSKDLEFASLTQLQTGEQGQEEISMFKAVQGEGGYQGATVNFDLTVDGAYSLSQSLAPFNLPVGITAKTTHTMKPFRANFECKFQSEFIQKGRTDIRDGWIFWDDDIEQYIRHSSTGNGFCNLELVEGDINSAYLEAMTTLKQKFEDFGLKQTQLTIEEGEKYYAGVLKDADEHRRNPTENLDWGKHLASLDDRALAIEIGASVADFHWHTSVQNIEKLKSLDFSTTISLNGHETIRTGAPANLCLYYSAEMYAYTRCTDKQEREARSYIEARRSASKSPACKDSTTASDCGHKRAEQAQELRPPKGRRALDNLAGGRELAADF